LVQILSVALAFDAISWIAGCLLAARAEFRNAFRYSVLLSPVFFVLAYVGARLDGAEGVAICVAAFYALVTPYYSYLVFKRVGITVRDLASFYIYPAAAAALTMGAAYFVSSFVESDLKKCIVICIVGPSLYIFSLSLLNPALLRLAFDHLNEKFRKSAKASTG
jgi:hypothetical protein